MLRSSTKNLVFLILLLWFCAFVFSCDKKQTLEPDAFYTAADLPELSTDLDELYYKDAAYLAYIELQYDDEAFENQIQLNETLVNMFYADLVNIYNYSYNLGESFFRHFMGIHNHHSRTLYSMIATADTSATWIYNITNGDSLSGIQSLDSLIIDYDLTFEYLTKGHNSHFFTINTSSPLNTHALANKLLTSGAFKNVEQNAVVGLNSSISFSYKINYKYYSFNLGWGDCPSGCLHSHTWVIKVSTTDEISPLREYGDPL